MEQIFSFPSTLAPLFQDHDIHIKKKKALHTHS